MKPNLPDKNSTHKLTKAQKKASLGASIAVLVFTVVLTAFLALAKWVANNHISKFDIDMMHGIYRYFDASHHGLVVFITNLSGPKVVIGAVFLMAGLLFVRRRYNDGLQLIFGVGGASFVGMLMKMFFERARPELWERIAVEATYSFPSGHAIASASLVVSLVVILWHTRFKWLTIVLGVLWMVAIAFTRLYLGLHFPTDILAGWLVAIAWVALMSYIFDYVYKNEES